MSPAATGLTAVLTSSPTPATGNAPLTVTFDASGSSDSDGTITSWDLSFGDGSPDASGTDALPTNTSHTYSSGTYTATLTVNDDQGASNQATVTVTANANVPPTAVLTSSPTPATGKAPLHVTFDGSGSSDSDGTIASWDLSFGDGSPDASGTGPPPSNTSHTYSSGTYTATLMVTDDQGASDQATVSVTANANVPPNAVLTSSPTPATGKTPLHVTFNGSGSSDSDGTIASWDLSFGDGSADASGTGSPPSNTSHTYTTPGSDTATLTVTDNNGATDTASVSVTPKANVPPTAVLTSSPTPATGKAPLNVTFNGSGSSDSDGTIASWTLDFGDNSTDASGSGTPPSSLPHTYAAGTYTAVLTVKDDNGASGTDSVAVDANAPPTAALTADKTSGPNPLAVKFDGSGSTDSDGSIASWTLSFGDGGSTGGTGSVPNSIPHTYTSACSCTASLKVTDNQGAQSAAATVAINVTTNQPPVAILTATPTPTTGTVPLNVTFDGSQSNDPDNIPLKSWSLDFGDSSTKATGTGAVPNSVQHTYSAVGTYHAVLTVTDSSNASTSSTAVTVTVNPQPTISVGDVSQNEGNSGTTNFNFPVTLSAVSTHDVTVDYATADGTATAGSDYTATNGTLTIPAGTDCTNPAGKAACRIPVPVTGDTIYENNETFTLNLSNPTGATIADGTATGTIVNDDQPPLLEAESGATLEGNTGSVVSGAQSWSAGGSLQLNDASGFPNSEGTHTFYISTPGSPSVGGPYTYNGLSGNMLTGVSPAGSVAVGQIAFQARFVTVPVVLCDPQKTPDNNPADCVPTHSGLDTKVHYATSDGHSLTTSIPVIEGQDYVSAAGTLTIPAGQPSGSVTFQTIPNTTPENPTDPADDLTRWFNVLFSSPTNATIEPGDSLGIATIIEDDGLNPPTATTGAASSIGADHATVAATVNPNGDATDVFVQYGPTDSYGSQTATQHLAAGNSAQALTFSLTGLSPGTKYHYQVVATHSDHSAGYGQDEIFTTDVPPTAVLKADKTSGPVPLTVTFDGAGSSDPDGSIASWSLDFGDGSSRGGTGAVPSAIAHTYASSCACKASLTVTDNQGGRSTSATVSINVGPTKTKKGLPPKFSTYNTTVGPTSAKIVFPVDPNGAQTRVWVEYGTSPSYGQMSGVQTIPAGSTQTLTFTLTGLSPATVYHYALFAAHTTDSGAAHSQDLTIRTQKLKSMSVTLKARSMRATNRGTVSLSFYCGGNALGLCKGRALLRLGHLAAGSVSFSVARGHRKRVSLKLKKTVLERLLASSGLRLGLNLSVQTGTEGVAWTTLQIKVLPPRK